MLRMTRQADYAIVLLTCVAARPEGLAARDLAAKVHLPLPMVSKILKTLAREGLLVSQRGAHGGYRLARSAQEISVAEIVTAIEGPIGITECTTESLTSCDIAAMCSVKSNWQKINQVVRHALDQVTLQNMSGPIHLDTADFETTGIASDSGATNTPVSSTPSSPTSSAKSIPS